jgi:hypothetical protein
VLGDLGSLGDQLSSSIRQSVVSLLLTTSPIATKSFGSYNMRKLYNSLPGNGIKSRTYINLSGLFLVIMTFSSQAEKLPQ